MIKAIFIATFFAQANAISWAEVFSPVQDGFGRMADDVASIRDSIDCTVSAVEQVFTMGGLFASTSEYYDEKCGGKNFYENYGNGYGYYNNYDNGYNYDNPYQSYENDNGYYDNDAYNTYDSSYPYDSNSYAVENTPIVHFARKDIVQAKKTLTKEIIESVSNTSEQIQSILHQNNATQQIRQDEESLKNETERLNQISTLLTQEVMKVPEDLRRKLNFDLNYTTENDVLQKVRFLYGVEQIDTTSAIANEVRHAFDKLLKLLGVTDDNGPYSDEDEMKLIITQLEKSCNGSTVNVQQVSVWTKKKDKQIDVTDMVSDNNQSTTIIESNVLRDEHIHNIKKEMENNSTYKRNLEATETSSADKSLTNLNQTTNSTINMTNVSYKKTSVKTKVSLIDGLKNNTQTITLLNKVAVNDSKPTTKNIENVKKDTITLSDTYENDTTTNKTIQTEKFSENSRNEKDAIKENVYEIKRQGVGSVADSPLENSSTQINSTNRTNENIITRSSNETNKLSNEIFVIKPTNKTLTLNEPNSSFNEASVKTKVTSENTLKTDVQTAEIVNKKSLTIEEMPARDNTSENLPTREIKENVFVPTKRVADTMIENVKITKNPFEESVTNSTEPLYDTFTTKEEPIHVINMTIVSETNSSVTSNSNSRVATDLNQLNIVNLTDTNTKMTAVRLPDSLNHNTTRSSTVSTNSVLTHNEMQSTKNTFIDTSISTVGRNKANISSSTTTLTYPTTPLSVLQPQAGDNQPTRQTQNVRSSDLSNSHISSTSPRSYSTLETTQSLFSNTQSPAHDTTTDVGDKAESHSSTPAAPSNPSSKSDDQPITTPTPETISTTTEVPQQILDTEPQDYSDYYYDTQSDNDYLGLSPENPQEAIKSALSLIKESQRTQQLMKDLFSEASSGPSTSIFDDPDYFDF